MASGDAAATSTTINIVDENSTDRKGKAAVAVPIDAPAPAPSKSTARVAPLAAIKFRAVSFAKGESKRGTAILDFILRICTIGIMIVASITMGTADETLPFVTQFFQFYANFSDLPALMFFVIGDAIAGGYLILSLPFSIATIVRPRLVGARVMLLIFDVVMVGLTTAAGSSAAAIVHLSHTGNQKANWTPICQQFDGFCEQINGAVIVSLVGSCFFMLLVIIAALALQKH